MPNDQSLNDLVTKFTTDLQAFIRAEALASVTSALGAPAAQAAAPAAEAPKVAAKKAAKKAVSKPAKKAAAKKSPNGQKRDPEALSKLVDLVGEWIKANPGQGMEHMKAALKLETKDLQLPIKKLLADKRIKSTGQKRATRYTAKS